MSCFTPTLWCKTQFVGLVLKAKGRCLGHSQHLFSKTSEVSYFNKY